MKAILRFDLSDPDDQTAFDRANRVGAYLSVLEGMYRWLRTKDKYPEEDTAEAYREAINDCREEFHRLCGEQGFDPLTGLPDTPA